jgi:hypothetical protein
MAAAAALGVVSRPVQERAGCCCPMACITMLQQFGRYWMELAACMQLHGALQVFDLNSDE